MPYNPNIHHRHTIRLQGYDYSQSGLYFVTICVQNRECLFGEIADGEMILNEYGKIVQMVWDELPQHYKNVELGEFIVMPNHIHGIIIITDTAVVGACLKPAQITDDTIDGAGCAVVGAGLKPAQITDDIIDGAGCAVVGAGLKPAPTGETKTHGLSEIVRALKTFSARKINEMRNTCGKKLWQRNFHEHIIRNEKSHQYIANYIVNNPAKWDNDKYYIK